MARIAIIGSGIVGVCTAAYLAMDGHEVTCFDERQPGEGTSFGNAGSVAPGAVVPTSSPRVLRDALKWAFDPAGPLRLYWSRIPAAAPWLRRFVRAGQIDSLNRSADGMQALHGSVFEHYRPLLGPDFSDILAVTGQMMIYEQEAAFKKDTLGRALREARGVRMEVLSGAELTELEPSLQSGLARGVLMPDLGQTRNPKRLVTTIAERAARQSVRFLTRKVHRLERGSQDNVTALLTDHGRFETDLVVVAAGVWSNTLLKPLGIGFPLESLRGYHVTFDLPEPALTRPVYSIGEKFMATPMETGLRVAGTVEIAGLGRVPNFDRASMLARSAHKIFRGLGSVTSEWMGHRPATPDSLPVIGRSPKQPNVYLACGHGQSGLCGAPTTGRLVADLIAGRPPVIDPKPYDIGRF